MPRLFHPRTLAASVWLGVLAISGAQSTAPRAEAVRPGQAPFPANSYFPPQDRSEAVDPDKKLGVGDELTYEIAEDREGGFPRVVTAAGDIDVPPVGRIRVVGRTTVEAAAEIKRLLERDYYHKATVKLSIDRVSRTVVKAGEFTLSGEVRGVGPIVLVAGERLTVSQAILKGGGFGPFANQRKVQVTRSQSGVKNQFYVDVKDILEKGNTDKDVAVQDGDRIFVPRNILNF